MRILDSRVSRRDALLSGAGLVGMAAGLSRLPLDAQAQGETPVLMPGGSIPTTVIDSIMQTSGEMHGQVYVVSLGRKDLNVTGPHGHPFKPAFAPNHTFFFQPLANGQVFMNAEFTFLHSEMNAVVDAIFANGLTLMAQHQHYIGSDPQTFHYHFHGMGSAAAVATAAINVVKATPTPLPQPKPANPTTPLPADQLASILQGTASVQTDGVVLVGVLRRDTIVEAGVQLLPQTNVLQKIAIEPLDSTGTTALFGADYAMTGPEVMPALTTSRSLGWEIHCLYNQQTIESPQLFFSHDLKWGDPLTLAREVRQVLDNLDVTGSPATLGEPGTAHLATPTFHPVMSIGQP